ncbi:transposase [Pelotomaculum sp. FP]|uniref:transposase n=1 Tax=Pelotomaculum sp. FP TaxID=261474 RepID=UPI0018649C3F|nr:transposase [Pelotomaculum sp. FP]
MQLHHDEIPFAKDCVYRFLNNCHYHWKKFLFLIAQNVVHNHLSPLASDQWLNVLIIDDSAYRRNRSKSVELLSRFKDHVENRYFKGFRMLTLGWSDGNSFVPLSFTLLAAEEEKQLCKIDSSIDKRSIGYRRRKEAVQKSTDALLQLLEQAKPDWISKSIRQASTPSYHIYQPSQTLVL